MEVVHESRFKVIFLGDSSVGKTSLAQLHQTGQVASSTKATIGFDCYSKSFQTKSGAFVQVQIWDTAGMERFRQSLTPRYYDLLNGAVLVYDITNEESFAHLESWIKEIETYCRRQSICLALVGNKADDELKRKVPTLKGRTFAQKYGMRFEELAANEVSSLAKLNTLMHHLMEEMYTEMLKEKEQISSSVCTKSVIELDYPSSYVPSSYIGPSDSPPPAYSVAMGKPSVHKRQCC